MPKWYFSKDRLLSRTPSRANGVDFVTESRYRREGCRFIMDMGNKLGLRYDTMATGVIYYHRFYMKQSFKTFPRWVTACACLFLAGKVEETPKKCRDIIKVAKNMLADHHFLLFGENPREEVMMYERVLLQTIKFDLQVDHPYAILLKIGKLLKGDKGKVQKLVQMAWTFVNDSLSTNLCLRQKPEVLAIAHINLAGKLASFDLKSSTDSPSNKPWWLVFCKDCSATVVEEICEEMLELYGGKKKEKCLKAKEKLNIEKNEASSNTSSSTSSPSTTNSAVPYKKKRLNSKSTETGKSPLVSSLPAASTSQPDAVESKLVQPPAVENISPALTSDALPMQTNSVAIVSKTTSYSIPSTQGSSSTSSNISSIVPSSSAVIQSHVPTTAFINPVPQNSFLSATYSGPNYGIISQGKAESIIPTSTNSSFLPPTPQLDSLYPVPQNTIPTAQHPSSFVQTFSNIPLPPSHQQPSHQPPPHQQPPHQQPPHQQPPHQQPPHQQPPHQQPPHQPPPHQQPPHQQPPHQQPPHQQPPHQQPPHQPPLHQLYPAHHQLPPQQNAPPLPLHPHMITNQIPPTLPGNNNSNWNTLYNRPPPNNQPMGGGWLR